MAGSRGDSSSHSPPCPTSHYYRCLSSSSEKVAFGISGDTGATGNPLLCNPTSGTQSSGTCFRQAQPDALGPWPSAPCRGDWNTHCSLHFPCSRGCRDSLVHKGVWRELLEHRPPHSPLGSCQPAGLGKEFRTQPWSHKAAGARESSQGKGWGRGWRGV